MAWSTPAISCCCSLLSKPYRQGRQLALSKLSLFGKSEVNSQILFLICGFWNGKTRVCGRGHSSIACGTSNDLAVDVDEGTALLAVHHHSDVMPPAERSGNLVFGPEPRRTKTSLGVGSGLGNVDSGGDTESQGGGKSKRNCYARSHHGHRHRHGKSPT